MTRLKPPRIILTLRKVARYDKFILYGKESLLLMHKSFILLFVLVFTTFYSLLFSFLHLFVPFCSLFFLFLLNEKKIVLGPSICILLILITSTAFSFKLASWSGKMNASEDKSFSHCKLRPLVLPKP